MLARMFAVVCRYDGLSEDKSAYQAALPRRMLLTLRRLLGVTHECYASPLNRYFGSYCSAFADTDAFFGSVGPFQQFWPAEGSFEANPPFDQQSVIECFEHVVALFRAARGPLSFVMVIPEMDMSHRLGKVYTEVKPYLRRTVLAKAGKHKYLMGLQHRPTGDGLDLFWEPEKASVLYFLQNDQGAQKWPTTNDVAALLLNCFDVDSCKNFEEEEVEYE